MNDQARADDHRRASVLAHHAADYIAIPLYVAALVYLRIRRKADPFGLRKALGLEP